MHKRVFLGLTLIALLVSLAAFGMAWASARQSPLAISASIPSVVSYQGLLTDAQGSRVSDEGHAIAFRLYNDPSIGRPLWEESQKVVTTDGVFSVLLGSVEPFPDDLFAKSPLYLGVQVDGESEMTPRHIVSSVPFAIHAGNANTLDGLNSAAFARADHVHPGTAQSVTSPESLGTSLNPHVSTPLGKDVFMLTSMSGHEEMSRLFSYQLEMLSDRSEIEATALLGQNMTITIDLPDGGQRHFNGFVSCFTQTAPRVYQAEVVPWLWFLTRTSDCRIFQNKSAPEIIETVFNGLGFTDYEFRLAGTYPVREYSVQYCESDFNFVSRLMEEEGVFYFFKHEDGKHTLKLADHSGAYEGLPEKEVSYQAPASGPAPEGSVIEWARRGSFVSGKWAHTDYNFEQPTANLRESASSNISPEMDRYEIYDYPGGYTGNARGRELAAIRMESETVGHDTVDAVSSCRTFAPGSTFTLTNHPLIDQNGTYLITSVSHRIRNAATEGSDPGAESFCRNSFTAIPVDTLFRPARVTPKPLVGGPQTAVVVGPAGQDIHTDEYGRVKVQFHWDREGKSDENSSAWMRVAHPWALGTISLPRIGDEVVVEFLDGDPDRPIVTGQVYNAKDLPLPFTGPQLVSSNGQYSVRVTDDGITIQGPGGTIRIGPTDVEVSAVELDLQSDASLNIQSGAFMDLRGAILRLNGGCLPVARVTDQVAVPQIPSGQTIGQIISGSPVVLVC